MLKALLYQGDCLSIEFPKDAAIVSDPPYGGNYDTDYSKFTRKRKDGSRDLKPAGNKFKPILGDDKPFDPSPWLGYKKVVLFGSNCFGNKLPMGTTLVWLKKRDSMLGKWMSDCELAWQKGGKGVFLYKHIWSGCDRETERGQRTLHPTQKPVELMKWVIGRLRLPPGATIVDPYMGSGATGVAAIELGYHFIRVEQDEEYFETAHTRIRGAQYRANLQMYRFPHIDGVLWPRGLAWQRGPRLATYER